ncbi:hypothetical protein JHK86_043409 [Glycine max]|nr:hypothetical protein JHK86_043409 [Glycine max]
MIVMLCFYFENSAMKSVTKTAEGKPPQHGPQWIEAKVTSAQGGGDKDYKEVPPPPLFKPAGGHINQAVTFNRSYYKNTFMSTTVLYRDRSSINTVSYDGRPQQNTVVVIGPFYDGSQETTVVEQDYVYDGVVPMAVVVFRYFYDGAVRQSC